MNNNVDTYTDMIKDRYTWDVLQDRLVEPKTMQSILKFHQSGSNFIDIHNYTYPFALHEWIRNTINTDVVPRYTENEIFLPSDHPNDFRSSCRSFDYSYEFTLSQLGNVLNRAFGRSEHSMSKRHPSAGALYPVIPLLCIPPSNIVHDGVTSGCYVYDGTHNKLLLLHDWSAKDTDDLSKASNVSDSTLLSNIFMAYAIDLRRSISKYGVRGYRHALIEVGLTAQSFRESLQELDEAFGECCWSGFADNKMTYMCGLNVRLAPVVLLQWFGRTTRED